MEALVLSITATEILKFIAFVGGGGAFLWKVSSVLNAISNDINIIKVRLETVTPQLTDHETRIRHLENVCSACDERHKSDKE